ncbi:MAG: hypothetical protein ACJ8E1_01945 [Xanthobacteraceae bacterium]
MRSFVQTAACGLVASVLVLGGSASRAVAEDDDTSFDQKIIQNVLGKLGVRGGADIEYRERSPLVLPPKIDLPPPQTNATTGTKNWPVDPDAKRRREEANRRRDEVEESRPLRPSELNVGERTRNRGPAPTQEEMELRPNRNLGTSSGILGSVFGNKDERVQFTEEPPRTSLIEPPAGYQTPSPNQPYTAKPEKWVPQIPSFFDFGTGTK